MKPRGGPSWRPAPIKGWMTDSQIRHQNQRATRKRALEDRRDVNRRWGEQERLRAIARRAPAGSLGAALA